MDLNKLFELFCQKKLGYIDCNNHVKDKIRFFASTGYNGRGRAVELSVYENIISIRLMTRHVEPIEESGITEERAFELIEKFDTTE